MFDHKLLATDGLYPGLTSHFSIAVLGTFLFDIIITPPSGPSLGYSDLEYQITVMISYKGKVWKVQRFVSYFTGGSLEKVLMTFRKISNKFNDLRVRFTKKSGKAQDVTISVNHKR
jgi:hypothetical protein